jgi:hypothetical protein
MIRVSQDREGFHSRASGFLCLSVCLRYNRRMAFDPAHPPIWLRKLHVTAAEIDPSDYAPTPEEGILRMCRLSDEMNALSRAFAEALGTAPFPAADPFDNSLSLHRCPDDQPPESASTDVIGWADRLGLQGELHYVLQAAGGPSGG